MGERITINKEFTWAEDIWKILYIEESRGTLVLHLCKGVAVEKIQKAYEKEQKFGIPYMLPEDRLSEEQRLIREHLHPLIDTFDAVLIRGDREYSFSLISMEVWNSVECYDDPQWISDQKQAEKTAETFNLDKNLGWAFYRLRIRPALDTEQQPITAESIKNLQDLKLRLSARKELLPGEAFSVQKEGEVVSFVHPTRKTVHRLEITAYETFVPGSDEDSAKPEDTGRTAMRYTVTPDLGEGEMKILDCGGGHEGTIPALMFYGGAKNEHGTLSFRRDDPAEKIVWRMFFSEKIREDITVSLQ